jgi:hypothetical protein
VYLESLWAEGWPPLSPGKSARLQPIDGSGYRSAEGGVDLRQTISYKTEDFLNRDIFHAIRYGHAVLKGHQLRFVSDRGFDDEKTFAFIVNLDEEFIIRLYLNRILQIQRGQARTEKLLRAGRFQCVRYRPAMDPADQCPYPERSAGQGNLVQLPPSLVRGKRFPFP